jgi:isochorismate pyruvate lyase
VKKPEDCESLEDVRGAIDALDREIVAPLGARSHYVEAAARFKTSEEYVHAPKRQRAMLEERRRWAKEEGLSPEVIEDLYKTSSPTS